MSQMKKHIGKFTHKINVSSTFLNLAQSDEKAAILLSQSGHYQQSCYFIIQSMEKHIRAKIFTLVNPNNDYFRARNQSHSLEDAVEFLIEIISTDELIKAQVSNQIKGYVLGDTNYKQLHNNLRYPTYFSKYDSYSSLSVAESDSRRLFERLDVLKNFLNDLGAIV